MSLLSRVAFQSIKVPIYFYNKMTLKNDIVTATAMFFIMFRLTSFQTIKAIHLLGITSRELKQTTAKGSTTTCSWYCYKPLQSLLTQQVTQKVHQQNAVFYLLGTKGLWLSFHGQSFLFNSNRKTQHGLIQALNWNPTYFPLQ